MHNGFKFSSQLKFIASVLALIIALQSCKDQVKEVKIEQIVQVDTPEYFLLRPEAEKAFGYSHAVRIGNDIKISGAVSMDDKGIPTAKGDLLQQMKNCYSDLDKVLKHYGCTFDDVVVENILTTNMPEFLKQSAYRNTIYKKQFPTGSWFGVRELALPEFMIEIELEAHKAR
ncbi:RidA family protein [Flavihumibacter profundi]|uniref:RidA family protein n=1 Tax=Flavihumibacter profundi TaxID=2716883 RepID=UPI001CC3FA32|nr:RidA family protein [Flavihumibacter profundi]MBZ5858405.1 RidA family protein [Flavihumibacter profundi]